MLENFTRKLAVLALSLGLGAMAGMAQADEPLKVGFVYIGPVGDAGWTYSHDLGRKALEEALGSAVETVAVENVPEGPESQRVFEDLAAGATSSFSGPASAIWTRWWPLPSATPMSSS